MAEDSRCWGEAGEHPARACAKGGIEHAGGRVRRQEKLRSGRLSIDVGGGGAGNENVAIGENRHGCADIIFPEAGVGDAAVAEGRVQAAVGVIAREGKDLRAGDAAGAHQHGFAVGLNRDAVGARKADVVAGKAVDAKGGVQPADPGGGRYGFTHRIR